MPSTELIPRGASTLDEPTFGLSISGWRRAAEVKNATKLAVLKIQGHDFIGALSMWAACRLDEERLRLLGDDLDPRHMLRAELLAKIEVNAVGCMMNLQRSMFGGW